MAGAEATVRRLSEAVALGRATTGSEAPSYLIRHGKTVKELCPYIETPTGLPRVVNLSASYYGPTRKTSAPNRRRIASHFETKR